MKTSCDQNQKLASNFRNYRQKLWSGTRKHSSRVILKCRCSLNVQRLGLDPDAVQTCGDASLGLLLFDSLDALHDQALAVHLDAFDEPLQDELLILALEEREVSLDAVEVGTIRDIEDGPRLQALACLEDLLGLVHLQVCLLYTSDAADE